MTILVISLLRLGDLILQRPLIEGLRRKHPGCEIHLVANRQFNGCEFLFEGLVARFHYFDREALQKSSGENQYNILWGFAKLQAFVASVNSHSYEHVYNLTHNRLSAHLAGLISAKRYHGLHAAEGKFLGLNTPWIRFFNAYFGRPEATGFHYTELLALALDIPLAASAQRESSVVPRSEGAGAILLQPLTSDVKKNWRIEGFLEVARRLKQETALPVLILGAPFERGRLETIIPADFLRICELDEAAALIRSASLLVTGDTSIKHLAAMYDTNILELSLGSSQPLQVGAFKNDSIILQPRVSCGPCPHSEPCAKTRHLCGDELTVDAVTEAALALVGNAAKDWMKFAYDHPELRVFATAIRPVVGWTVECLSIADKSKFDEVLQQKTMIVEELNRRQEASKGVSHEQRFRSLPERGTEAS
jgi:ADP-heptose:LPS heptosyltransferase